MKNEDIVDYVKNHPAGRIKIAFTDIDGVLRGKYISTAKFLSVIGGTSGFCDVIFGWDAGDVAYDNASYTGWHTGYPDAPCKIDITTFRRIPWENDLPFFLGELTTTDNHDAYACPRQLVKKVVNQAVEAGFHPVFSQEFEWFNYAETPQSAAAKNYRDLQPISPGMFGYSILRSTLSNPFFADLFDMMTKFGVPIEGLHTETGPGVLEAAIMYADMLEAADRAVLFKTGVKEIAYRHNVMATFMAKVSENLPGCGGHVHQSLWDKSKKKNVFHSDDDETKMSALMKSYVAGQLFCLPHILPMFAPTINSYKRLVEGAWAPTTLTWARDNRTVALRVLSGGNSSCRLETRVIGSDANPYLAMAACLASGLYGIKNNLQLQPETNGNGYRDTSHGVLPGTLHEATLAMKHSTIAREIVGEKFVTHFVQTREWEWRQHLKPVTDWETKRYFEII